MTGRAESKSQRLSVPGSDAKSSNLQNGARRLIELVLPTGVLRIVGQVLDSDESGLSFVVEPAPINPPQLVDALEHVITAGAQEPVSAGSQEMLDGGEVDVSGARALSPLLKRNHLAAGEHEPPPLPVDADDDIPEVEEDFPQGTIPEVERTIPEVDDPRGGEDDPRGGERYPSTPCCATTVARWAGKS